MQLQFDFTKPVSANLISSLLELHKQLKDCAANFHLPHRLYCFSMIESSALNLRHYLFEHGYLTADEYDLLSRDYHSLTNQFDSFIRLNPEAL